MYIVIGSIFIVFDKNNGFKEAALSKNIGKLGLIISLSKGVNDGNIFRVERNFDIDMKLVRSHAMQASPVRASNRTREIAYQAKNIIRELHFIKNISIYETVQFYEERRMPE